MNYKNIVYILGYVVGITGIFMLLPFIVGLIYGETACSLIFFVCAAVSSLIGFLCGKTKVRFTSFTVREGYVAVALSWLVMSAIGALPFTIAGEIPSYLDALFEIVSGFTTTGASILSNVEGLSYSMLFWRSFSHWIGGMGVLVFILTILPMADSGASFSLMQAESPGPVVSKLVPRLRASARHLYAIYLGISVLELIFLLFGRMPLFDALCTTFGTMGTGGFGVLNTSMASYSPYLQWVVTIFMLLAGTNFGLYFLLICRQWKAAGSMEEVRWYYIIIALAALFITGNLIYSGQFTSFREVLFQIASIITTTGFATTDFDVWPLFSKNILVMLMFIGACAGSTGGGIKVSRILIYFKSAATEISTLAKPNQVRVPRMDGKRLDNSVIRGALIFLASYTMIFFTSLFLIAWDAGDFTTAFTAVAATLNNIGPGLAAVGPTCNYAFFSPLSKIVLIFDMLAGRLEVFPLLILFAPNTWKHN